MDTDKKRMPEARSLGLSDEDIIEGMKALHGYIDLTPHDFKLLYEKVYAHARRRILHEYTALDIMRSPVLSIDEDDSLEDLIFLLARYGYSGLPVLDRKSKLSGVVSSKDVLIAIGYPATAHAMWLVANSLKTPLAVCGAIDGKTVKDIMSAPPLFARPETSMAEIACIFREKCINRLPVADDSGRLHGLIARSDLINSLSKLL